MSFVQSNDNQLRGLRRSPRRAARLAGLGAVPTFEGVMIDARAAIARLSVLSHTLEISASDPAQKNIASLAIVFTDQKAPRLLSEANEQRDVTRLLAVQKGTASIYKVVFPEIRDSIIDRFLSGPILGLLPADSRDSVNEAALEFADKNLNPLLKDGLDVVHVAGGIAAVFALGYLINSFRGR